MEEIILDCCRRCQAQGIKILPGPTFDLTQGAKPIRVNALGAVMYVNNLSSWKSLAKLLDCNFRALYSFSIGFDVGNKIAHYHNNLFSGTEVEVENKHNKLGLTIRRLLCPQCPTD